MRVTIGRGSRRISVTLVHPSKNSAEAHEANVRQLCELLGLYPGPWGRRLDLGKDSKCKY